MDVSSLMATPNVAMLSTQMSQAKATQDLGVAVLSNVLDANANAGAELTKMMELSVNPSVGSNFDALV